MLKVEKGLLESMSLPTVIEVMDHVVVKDNKVCSKLKKVSLIPCHCRRLKK